MSHHQNTSIKHSSLVFLHGFLGSHRDWSDVQAALPDDQDAHFLDLPGHGTAPLPAHPVALTDLAQSVVDELDNRGLAAAILVGYSLGGRVALTVALHHPGRLRALVLESASPGLEDNLARNERLLTDQARAAFLRTQGLEAFLDRWYELPLFESLRAHPGFPATLERRRKGDASALARVIEELSPGAQPNLWPRLPEIQTPTLLLAGADDEKYRSITRQAARLIPGAQREIIEGCGHNIHLEAPKRFLDRLNFFTDHLD